METKEIFRGKAHFPLLDREELAKELDLYELGLDYPISRTSVEKIHRTDALGNGVQMWRASFYSIVENVPIYSQGMANRPSGAKERQAFTMEVPAANPAICEGLVEAACRERGILTWRSRFERRHNADGLEIYLATVFEIIPKVNR